LSPASLRKTWLNASQETRTIDEQRRLSLNRH
jgi:hypothetical protein